MTSALKQPNVAVAKMTLEPMMTLERHEDTVRSMHYFPDGERMISESYDRTARQWDMQTGKEIEEARNVCEWGVQAVAVSRDGRWVITAGGYYTPGELNACEVETEILKTFQGHSRWIYCIDICAESRPFASRSNDRTTWIWNLDTGKLVAGPFESPDCVGAVRFSRDSTKLAKLDKRVGELASSRTEFAPVFWTNEETILAAFSFITEDLAATTYEFDASTLETRSAPTIVDVPLAHGLSRVAIAGAPKNGEDLVLAEYFDIPSSNPDSRQPNAAMPINSGEHGSSRLCFCV
ncbi:WD40 repeat-like protein [Rhizopogon salebrosus TDB-379]|nr:WD40 repeat-like protein [Rhizopogon salebrosus TDB-379]